MRIHDFAACPATREPTWQPTCRGWRVGQVRCPRCSWRAHHPAGSTDQRCCPRDGLACASRGRTHSIRRAPDEVGRRKHGQLGRDPVCRAHRGDDHRRRGCQLQIVRQWTSCRSCPTWPRAAVPAPPQAASRMDGCSWASSAVSPTISGDQPGLSLADVFHRVLHLPGMGTCTRHARHVFTLESVLCLPSTPQLPPTIRPGRNHGRRRRLGGW